MPIPVGASQVPGNPNRVRLSNGDVVTRSTARTLGAREMGYRNERDRGIKGKGDDKFFRSFSNSPQGRHALAVAKAQGMKPDDLKIRLIAARNSRPHPRSGKSGGPAYISFMQDYDLMDMGPYDIGDS